MNPRIPTTGYFNSLNYYFRTDVFIVFSAAALVLFNPAVTTTSLVLLK